MKASLLGLVIVVGLLGLPASASAATCADYDNQADAQRAADTRDGDGDGIYCEALPCPCARPGTSGGGGDQSGSGDRPRRTQRTLKARITSVVDGDTVRVKASSGRFYTVRLVGVDTPETRRPGVAVECGGKQATAKMLRLAFTRPSDTDGDGLADRRGGTGRAVWVRTDTSQETYDRYGRLLAYVTTRSNPKNLALEQIRAGWAKVYVYERRFAQYARFKSSQDTARSRSRGVWGTCAGDFHSEQ